MNAETSRPQTAPPPPPDMKEYGGPKDGARQASDRRLFMQLLVFTGCPDAGDAAKALGRSGLEAVLYADVNDPRGVGVLLVSEDPSVFAGTARRVFNEKPFSKYAFRPEFTMIGRTYSIGYERDLEDWLLEKPRRNVFEEKWPWAVWYPLRRTGAFAALPAEEQRAMLSEHGQIGMGYGDADLAHDVRLACHGLDANDNEFLLGLVGKDLHPLSRLVQDMRKTKQTSSYIQKMGPFFVGRALQRFPRKK